MEFIFFILALLIVASAFGVVVFRNAINSALCLVCNLLCVAALFAMLEAHFLAAVQIIVYAGAIMVLVVFVLMLLNTKLELPARPNFIILFFGVLGLISFLALSVPLLREAFRVFESDTGVVGSVEAVGKLLYTRYVFPFEAASLLLMAAIAGAVMLAKRRYR